MNTVIRREKVTIRRFVFAAIFFVAFSIGNVTFADEGYKAAKDLSNAFASAAARAMPAVVSIKVEKTIDAGRVFYQGDQQLNVPFDNDLLRQFFGGQMPQMQTPRKYKEEGQGSGFIISKDGYILTNNHVVGDVDKITVELQDGRKFTNAKVIGSDKGTEVALIKIDGDDFPVLPMGDSEKNKIGDWVIAIGNPFGLSESVTVGVISALGRNNLNIANYENFIQTDAAINPGNSGGPLINLDGQVIGINTAIYSENGGYMGIGFAIPIDMARNIEKQLKENGKVIRGYLGIACQDVTPEMTELLGLKNSGGIIIATVEKDSPAEKSGLMNQDVILELNGNKIESYEAFRNDIANIKPDSKVKLTISRDGKTQNVTVTLAERTIDGTAKVLNKEQPKSKAALGVNVQNVTNDIARQLGYKAGEGVVVTSVYSGSPASEAGIESGDLIISVNKQNVNSADDFEKAINSIKGNKVLLLVKHGEISQFVVIQLAE